ncbi:MAG TPA: hypothetical protein VFX81_10890 [Burkholderiaceae bacterium]|nr:hypothetical protein [Burkholderiaceae bacterium]
MRSSNTAHLLGQSAAAWRYIDYQMKSGKPVEDVNFSGPAIAAVFRW